jgi:superfamily II DNA or RNA helicase
MSALSNELPHVPPEVGDLVHVRSRRWLVEAVDPEGGASLVSLACAEDDAQGEELRVLWELELDRAIVRDEGWSDLGTRGFDEPRTFAAFLNTLRWNAVTATDPTLFQAPFRAGIKLDAYQMEPLRKALQLPRVNLFIADDTGLGKTIEAGLIATELLLRKKAKSIVVGAPPSVLEQWKAELEERFGLTFVVLDRDYLARMRRDRGFGVNPWRTHSRFLVSHNLLIDPTYAEPLREWLGELSPGSLLILDEAHHAAPSSGSRYGIETKFTRAIRDLAPRFEHRLFLSATPHNGHSSSFSTLLELLDPYRFTRGVPVRGDTALKEVMVRRLKEDIRQIQDGFPKRQIVPHVLDGLPEDTPELILSRLLDEYRTAREGRLAQETSRARASAGLLVIGLQQRLLSSIEAFARSLKVHRESLERKSVADVAAAAMLLVSTPDNDDERAALAEDEHQAEDDAAVAAVSAATTGGRLSAKETELLDRMTEIAEDARYEPDEKTKALINWIRDNLCPELPAYGEAIQPGAPPPTWNERRVLIFTENRQGTKRHIETVLAQAIGETDRADERIATITGLTAGATRKEVQRRFNANPAKDPLRILIATDAAREGLNFQAHCTDLFHFDLPWNPGRIEQRNGRIDRKLQPADEVRCHHFLLPQRIEDRVLEVLVRKTKTIREELGSLSPVLDSELEQRLVRGGIRHAEIDSLLDSLEKTKAPDELQEAVTAELDSARERQDELHEQIDRCRRVLDKSRRWVGFDAAPFRDALSCALELLGADGLQEQQASDGTRTWSFPALEGAAGRDTTWAGTLDSLRTPRPSQERIAEWRAHAPIRPIVFEDAGVVTDATVHLHLEQRVAQRLLARFRSQGFLHDDLSRACVAQVEDAIPRVVLLGRLCLYGRGAERLHEVVVRVAARWIEADRRSGPLKAYGRDAETQTMQLLDRALAGTAREPADRIASRLLDTAAQDVTDLLPQLETRALELAATAESELRARGTKEAESLRETLGRQQQRVARELKRRQAESNQMRLDFAEEERRQLAANMANWERRLEQFDHDMKTEPERLAAFYEIQATRIEPVGLVYLWPETN